MNKFVAKKYLQTNSEVEVAGRNFKESNWREAILYYLHGMWAANPQVTCKSSITFDGVTLKLDVGTKKYWCFVRPMMSTSLDTESGNPLIELHNGVTLEVRDDQDNVEMGLMRLVRNDNIGCLTIHFDYNGSKSSMSLHKTSKRGEYLTSGQNLGYLPPRRG
jgi:hypothetical protein